MISTSLESAYLPPARDEMISRLSPLLGRSWAGVPQIGQVVGFMDLLAHRECGSVFQRAR
jgi:hypothetical protein